MDPEFFPKDECLIIRKILFCRNNKNRSYMGAISERPGVPNHALTPFSSRPAVWYIFREFGNFCVPLTQVLDGLYSDRGVHAKHLSHCVTLTCLFLDPQPQRVYDVIHATEFCQEKQSKALSTKLDFSWMLIYYNFITVSMVYFLQQQFSYDSDGQEC